MTKLATGILVTMTALGLSACVYVDQSDTMPDPLPNLAQQQDNPLLALADEVLKNHFAAASASADTAATGPVPTTCIAANDGRSPEALPQPQETALMERHPKLAPLLRCVDLGEGLQDETTGEPATVIELHSFTCSDEFTCSGWASAKTGGTGSPSMRYSMEWGAGGWSFVREQRLIADQ